jgi:selenocysteine lyase/cysteine desulfurase
MGVKIDMVKSRNGIVRAEDIIEAVKPRTKLISVSQVQFLSGYRIDLKILGDYCKDKGIILAVDAIQGVGALKLNVNELNIGFVSCGTQKWMMGLLGLSFIYLSEDLQSKLEQKFVGWTSVENAWDFLNYDLKLKKSASAFENGTLNALGIYALEEAIKLFDAYGYDKVEETVINNSIYIMKRLESIGINSILSKCQKEFLSGIVSFYHPDNERIFEELSKRKISCSLRGKMIRLSPHFYNTNEDVDIVVHELKKILNS